MKVDDFCFRSAVSGFGCFSSLLLGFARCEFAVSGTPKATLDQSQTQ